MNQAYLIIEAVKTSYAIVVMAVLGVFAIASAAVISWPAISYLVSKLIF